MVSFKETWEKIALGALLHDIGKLIHRNNEYQSLNLALGEGHQSLSLWYYNELVSKRVIEDDEIVRTVIQRHHENYLVDKSFLLQEIADPKLRALAKLVANADSYSSKERDSEEKEEREAKSRVAFNKRPLDSVFGRIKVGDSKKDGHLKYHLAENQPEKMFVSDFLENTQTELKERIESFYKESMSIVANDFNSLFSQLLLLIEKHTWCLPSDTQNEYVDIPLYDHLKTTSAIALANYYFHERKNTLESIDAIEKSKDENHFLIIGCDISGIQRYIFGINSEKYSAKRLRARSFSVKALTEILAHKIVRDLNLTPANILMNSGGKVTILAYNDSYVTDYIDRLRVEMEKELYMRFRGEVFISIDSEEVSGEGLVGDGDERSGISYLNSLLAFKLENRKGEKFRNLIIENPIFTSKRYGKGGVICPVCGIHLMDSDSEYCGDCAREINLGTKLPKSSYLALELMKEREYADVSFLGIKGTLVNEGEIPLDTFTLINFKDSKLLGGYPQVNGSYGGYVPLGSDGEILTFGEIASYGEGVKNLGVLKADVDNLGLIFNKGFREDNTKVSVSRISNLSKLLDNFFSKYVEHLFTHQKAIKYMNEEIDLTKFYLVYSGGDDLMVVGPWNKLVLFSAYLKDELVRYTKNSAFTMSVGIHLGNANTPFLTLAKGAEDMEGVVKNSGKNGLGIFGRYLPWSKFLEFKNLADYLEKYLKNREFSQSFIYRLLNYTEMAEKYYFEKDAYSLSFISKYQYDIRRNLEERKFKNRKNELELLNSYFLPFKDGEIDREKIEFLGRYMRIVLNYVVRKNREIMTK